MAATLSGILKFPPFEGQSNAEVPISASFTFEKKVELEDVVTGSGTVTADLSAFGPDGAKMVVVFYKASTEATATPVLVTINAGVETEQLQVGGFKISYNPVPAAAGGILSVEIAHTGQAEIAVWAFA
jgi:hypothetical protein